MQLVKVQEVKITKVPAKKGGTQITWNVDLDGKPFGQIWTFKNEPGSTYNYTAKALSGAWDQFVTYAEAEAYMRGLM